MHRLRSPSSSLSTSPSSSPEPPLRQQLDEKRHRIIAALEDNAARRVERSERTSQNNTNTLQNFFRRNGMKHNIADSEQTVLRRNQLRAASTAIRQNDTDISEDDDDMKKLDDDKKKDEKPSVIEIENNVVQERMTKYPPQKFDDAEERECIMRDMREYISVDPRHNSHWLKLVKRFRIGYVQAMQMRARILIPTDRSGRLLMRPRMKPDVRKAVQDWQQMFPNRQWLSAAQRAEIRRDMRAFIARNPRENSNWRILALRFNIGYQQAVDIRSEIFQAGANTASTSRQKLLVILTKRAEELLRFYPKRRLSRDERARCKNEMTDLLLDHPELNNKWASLADRFQLGYEQVMELRNEIRADLGTASDDEETAKKPDATSTSNRFTTMRCTTVSDDGDSEIEMNDSENDNDNSSSSDADEEIERICMRPLHSSNNSIPMPSTPAKKDGSKQMPRRRTIAASDDEVEEHGVVENVDVPHTSSKINNATRQLKLSVDKIAHFYSEEQQSYEEIAALCNISSDRVRYLTTRYLAHLIDQRHPNTNTPYSLTSTRASQVQRVLRWLPRASILEISHYTGQRIGTVRAVLLHKIGVWRDYGDDEDDQDDYEAIIRHGNWRLATQQEKVNNGFLVVGDVGENKNGAVDGEIVNAVDADDNAVVDMEVGDE